MRVVFAILLCLLCPALASAERVALVIGNAGYRAVAPLDNPHNDAEKVTQALREQGFEVISARDLGRVGMRNALREFRELADGAEIALVYYAGHGIEIGGTNYLVPVDARLEDERDAELEMIDLDLVLYQISGAKRMKMVVLDACRNNPFVAKMRRMDGSRSVGQGLGDIRSTQSDTLIAYAAAAGEITPDGSPGQNSPFTAAFLAALEGPPTDVRRVLGRVRDKMRATVPGAAPFVYSSLGGGEYVINPKGLAPEVVTAPAPKPEAPARSISRDFVQIDREGTVADWDRFLIAYEDQSDHPLYAFALEKRQALMAEEGARPAKPDAPAEQVASLSPGASSADDAARGPVPVQETGETAPETPLRDRDELARLIQSDLKARGCYSGGIDGILGRGSRRGLDGFAGQAGVTLDTGDLRDPERLERLVAVLEAHPDVTCPKVARRQPAPSKPAAATTRSRTKPKASTTATTQSKPPAVRGNDAQRDDGGTNVQGAYTRKNSHKLAPVAPSDCIGNRRKFYDCD